ncbi:MAG: hypothetical protein QM784_20860 [Polyangiaceae bacterium]
MTDLVPQAVRDLLAFYSERYPEVRFGDLDISVLKRAVEVIDEAAKEVIAAEEALAQARQAFRGQEAELAAKAGRTLSFLKIFVDGDEEQLAQLEAISLAMPAARRRSKTTDAAASGEPKQRRPRKSKNAPEQSEEQAAERAIEEALEKAGLTDEELSELPNSGSEVDVDASDLESSPAASDKKSSSKSAAE